MSATAGRPPTVDFEQGARFPTIGVAAVFSQHPNSTDAAPYISLSIPQRTYDVDLRLNEAEELVQQLQGHIALVRGG